MTSTAAGRTERGRRTRKLFSATALFARLFRRGAAARDAAAEDSAWFRDNLQLIRQAYAAEHKPDYGTAAAFDRRPWPSAAGNAWCRRGARWSGSTTTVYSFAYFGATDGNGQVANVDRDDAESVEYIDAATTAATLPARRHKHHSKAASKKEPCTATSDAVERTIPTPSAVTVTAVTTGTRTRSKKYKAPPPPPLLQAIAQPQPNPTAVIPPNRGRQRRHRKGPAPQPPVMTTVVVPKPSVVVTVIGPKPQVASKSGGIAPDEKDRLRRRVDKIEKCLVEKATPAKYLRPTSAVYTEMAVTNITELDRRAAEICKNLSESTEAARRLSASFSVVARQPTGRTRPVSAIILPHKTSDGAANQLREKRLEFFERLRPLRDEDTPDSIDGHKKNADPKIETTITKMSFGTQTTGRKVYKPKTLPKTNDNRGPVLQTDDKKGCYQQLIAMENRSDLVTYDRPFECAVCLCSYNDGGIVLRDCLHIFCRPCLQMTIKHSKGEQVKCPYIDPQYSCTGVLQHREIKRILGADEEYEQYLQRSVNRARQLLAKGGSFQCRRPDCPGWCLIDNKTYVFEFKCPVCGTVTCVRCGEIHEPGRICERLIRKTNKLEAVSGETASDAAAVVENLIERGEAMECPGCATVLSKQQGCDWIKCAVCSTEICWATKGPRWGPNGKGDTSAGCKCGIPLGRKCHISCTYCH
ncbi:uncharacterized protein LOC126836536 [Adelges cooleyi]|uniref:uncharacterized protein LOC126836536 n=1 Tax=Adelges cooleyi TaxID=133065 RepID=UPI00217F3DC6|nr:uncharacterized protein LOC126836536 [Adelges cooleyi]